MRIHKEAMLTFSLTDFATSHVQARTARQYMRNIKPAHERVQFAPC